MNLYLLRHGAAVESGDWGRKPDSDRPLTPEGVDKMRLIAAGMTALDLSFDAIVSSPFTRARQTAEIVAKRSDADDRLTLTESLAGGTEPQKLVQELKQSYPKSSSLLLVGHEPSMSELISTLLVGDSPVSITLKKGGLCKLSVDSLGSGEPAHLEWLLTPNQLIKIGGKITK